MCGFAGFLGGTPWHGPGGEESLLAQMADTIAYRGPDDAGYWYDIHSRIGLAHRRLSIVDLSDAGHQPMQSRSARYVIAFNGEIYNHLMLRQELQSSGHAPAWRGHSDTETFLAGCDAWGIQGTVERAIGMFAIAVWDRWAGVLTLGRDRIGEKPLYYGWQGKGGEAAFLFGSELKALRAHPAFEHRISRDALSLQLWHNYIPAPHSIYEGISKLAPGCLLTVSLAAREPRIQQYWSLPQAAEVGVAGALTCSPREAVDNLECLLKDAVRQQMVADVPLGAFLSGGIDSSTVVALMQAQSSRPVKTFSIGFHEDGYDEAKQASAVARHLGTDHTELYVTSQEAMQVIPRLPAMYDEPFSDSSQIPSFLVSALAKQHVTVSLSGDGGDELFCGYSRYQRAERIWKRLASAPLSLRRIAAAGLTVISPATWNSLADTMQGLLPPSLQLSGLGHKLQKGAMMLDCQSVDALYLGLTSHWNDPASVVVGSKGPSPLSNCTLPSDSRMEDVQRMMALDMLTYLPDDILVKLDRAAMNVSLETRIPFLDHRIIEFAWRLPQSMKLRDGRNKWALRQVLYRHVPQTLVDRPKMGFGVPIGDWLRGPLREWAESLLDESRLTSEGYFKPALIRRRWEEHVSRKCNWQYHLWDVLMFQSWLEYQHSHIPQPHFSDRRLYA